MRRWRFYKKYWILQIFLPLLPHRCSSNSPGSSCQDFSFPFGSRVLALSKWCQQIARQPFRAWQIADLAPSCTSTIGASKAGLPPVHADVNDPPSPLVTILIKSWSPTPSSPPPQLGNPWHVGLQMSYCGAMSVHPVMRQNFVGKPYTIFYNIWDPVIVMLCCYISAWQLFQNSQQRGCYRIPSTLFSWCGPIKTARKKTGLLC